MVRAGFTLTFQNVSEIKYQCKLQFLTCLALLSSFSFCCTSLSPAIFYAFLPESDRKNRLVRHKHWFQHDILPELREERTLVIAQFRDPFYWIEGMQRKPHHAPMHYKLPTWKVFLET